MPLIHSKVCVIMVTSEMDILNLCHLNTLHQRPARDCILYKALLVGTCRKLTRESSDRYKVARKQ